MNGLNTRPDEPASFVIDGLTIWAGEQARPQAGWLWVENGALRGVGGDAPPDGVPVLQRPGMHALPGLVDAHRHFLFGCLMPLFGDASGWTSVDDALQAVAHAHRMRTHAQQWLVFTGMDYTQWRKRRPPSRVELDAAAPGSPVLVADITLHRGALSSPGLAASGLLGGYLDTFRDIELDRTSQPTGLVWEKAFGRAMSAAMRGTREQLDRASFADLLHREATQLLAQGHVQVHDIGLSLADQNTLAQAQSLTPLRLSWSAAARRGLLEAPRFDEDGYADSPHAPPSVKFFLDGAHRCAACLPLGSMARASGHAMLASLAQRSLSPLQALLEQDLKIVRGHVHLPYLRFGQAQDLVTAAAPYAEHGFRIRIHALGNSAAMVAVDALAQLQPAGGASIEHLLALAPDEVERVARSGAVSSVQPGFIAHYAPTITQQGVTPYLLPFPLRSLLDHGARVAISSDSPCGPSDALFNLRRAVDRRQDDGRAFVASEALSQPEAIAAASIGGLAAIGVASRGLSPGERADFVLCNGHPFEETSAVSETWIDGRLAWSRTATRI